jgi:two-component system sensor histidine kinase KdpD
MASINKSVTNLKSYFTGGLPPIDDSIDPVQPKGVASGKSSSRWQGYLFGSLLVLLTTSVGYLLRDVLVPTNTVMLYLLAIVITATAWGLIPSIMASVLGVLLFDFFLVPPTLTFRVHDAQYLFTFLVLMTVGILLSYTTARIRWQIEAARKREHQMSMLYQLARKLTTSGGQSDIIAAILNSTQEIFNRDGVLFLPDAEHKGLLKPFTGNPKLVMSDNELAAATWCFEHRKTTDRGTSILPNTPARFLPLLTARATVGVLALVRDEKSLPLSMDQLQLFEAFADLAAVALERAQFAAEAQRVEILRDSQKLQTALLNSISHDLRTPLVSILGALSSLEEKSLVLDENDKASLVQVAREETERLNRLITNLLDVSRIEADAVKLARQSSEVQDIIGVALGRLGKRADSHPVEIHIPADLPFVWVDSSLVAQVFVNVIENAMKYSSKGSAIEINACVLDSGEVQIEVADRGIGIPQKDLEAVFDKFYRVKRPDNVAGSGLGLAISRGIIEAHGEHIVARNRPNNGTLIQFTLPVTEANNER